ncbi:MAG: right-handed parallel beta-helix repeat-containing protein [Myxococcota bacterium]
MPRSLFVLALVIAQGCAVGAVDLVGKRCSNEHPCPAPLVCDSASAVCVSMPSVDPSCHLFDDENPITCTRRELYVAPDGDDGRDGLSAAAAWASIDVGKLAPGDRVHLAAGTYGRPLFSAETSVDGTKTCPIEILGPDVRGSGPFAEITQPIVLGAAAYWFHDLRFALSGDKGAFAVNFVHNIRLERLVFRNHYTARSYARDVSAVGADNLAVLSSDFDSDDGQVMDLGGTDDVLIRGNRFAGRDAAQVELGARARVLENEFFGAWGTPITGRTEATGTVERNLFHDIVCAHCVIAQNMGLVRANTFVSADGAFAADNGVFRDNIVLGLAGGTKKSAAEAMGAYNLYSDVAAPYGSGAPDATDRMGAPGLGADFVPSASSPAVDQGDPARAVPPGGGMRADIGALERGATRLPDGRYCTADGL